MTVVGLFSTALAGCWFYSRDTAAGCQKTSYGLAMASTSTEDCAPAADAGISPPPPMPPKIPSPGMM